MKILVVMINYNTSKKTIDALKSLFTIETVHNLNVVVIENSTILKEKEILKSYIMNNINLRFPIDYVDSHDNIGYAKAMNPQIKKAAQENYDYIWLLNNDLELEQSTLDILISFAIDRPNGIYCSLQKDFHDRSKVIETGTVGIDTFKGYALPTYNEDDKFIEVDAVLGASLVIDLNIVRSTNIYLSEHYFIYMEENDYCYRMKLKGYKSFVVMNSVVYHESGGSGGIGNPLIWYYRLRNLLLFKFEFEHIKLKVIFLGIYLYLMTAIRKKFKLRFLKAAYYAFYDAYYNNNEKTNRIF